MLVQKNKHKRFLFVLFLLVILGGLYLVPLEKGKNAIQNSLTHFLKKSPESTDKVKEAISF